MAFVHGKNTSLTFGTVTLTPYLNNVDFPRDAATADTTVFGINYAQFLNGVITMDWSATGLFDPSIHNALAAYHGGTAQAFTYGPAGTAAGNPKTVGTAVLNNYTITGAVADAVGISLSFKTSGSVTESTF